MNFTWLVLLGCFYPSSSLLIVVLAVIYKNHTCVGTAQYALHSEVGDRGTLAVF